MSPGPAGIYLSSPVSGAMIRPYFAMALVMNSGNLVRFKKQQALMMQFTSGV